MIGGEIRHVDDELHLLDATGKVLHVQSAPKNGNGNGNGTEASPTPPSKNFKTGWITDASWFNRGSPISSFATSWIVPPAPKTYDGQTVFLFNSIEPASYNAILQPVLQYGPSAAGGANYWAVASWYVVGSQAYHTTLVRVNAGQVLNGLITLKSYCGNNYNYASTFTNIGGTTLYLYNSPQLVWATETLEAYNIKRATDYPHGSTVFYNIYVNTLAGIPSVFWGVVNDVADGLSTIVNQQGASNARITVNYPPTA